MNKDLPTNASWNNKSENNNIKFLPMFCAFHNCGKNVFASKSIIHVVKYVNNLHMSYFAYACKTEGEKRNLPLNFNTCRKVWWCFFRTSTRNMVFNTPNINIFNTPWNFDIAFYMHVTHIGIFNKSENILKFQHAFLQEHSEISTFFYSFQNHEISTCCFQNMLKFHKFSEHAEIFRHAFL